MTVAPAQAYLGGVPVRALNRLVQMGGLVRRLPAVAFCFVVSCSLALGNGPSMADPSEPPGAQRDRSGLTAQQDLGKVGMIAYARGNIFTIHSDGSHRRKLTTSGAWGPAWSPDGATIAFERDDGIALMDSDGGAKRWLTEGRSPAWSPDGNRLSYTCRPGYDETDYLWGFSDLCVLDLRDGTETVVVDHATDWPGVSDSSWSPDGARIAFTRISADGDEYTRDRQLFTVRSDGTDLTAIPGTAPEAKEPAWSPDGTTIMYTSSYDGRGGEYNGDLVSIRPDGTARTKVTRLIGTESGPSWFYDGSRLAMHSAGGMLPNKEGIWTLSPDGTGRELVVGEGYDPSWRPGYTVPPTPVSEPEPASGLRIAYVAASDDGYDIFTVRPDGSRVRQLTFGGRAVDPAWSPGHSRIAYGEGKALRVVDVRSGKTERVARYVGMTLGGIGPYLGGITWSPDGHRLAWGSDDWLVTLDLRTRERKRIALDADAGRRPRDATWSPDGELIAFSLEEESGAIDIMVVPASGGQARRVTRLRGLERHLDWSPNGRRILFSHQRSARRDGDVDVMSVRPDGTGLRTVRSTPELDLEPAWSPDGRHVTMYSDGPRPLGKTSRSGLWTLGVRGGAPQLVVRDRSIAHVDW